jgi:hypothetical protein
VKQQRGFAVMDPAKRREICAKGGRSAHEQGVAHIWTSAEAILAGRRGQLNRRVNEKERADAAAKQRAGD